VRQARSSPTLSTLNLLATPVVGVDMKRNTSTRHKKAATTTAGRRGQNVLRAQHTSSSIVVYQAFSPAIADAAVDAGTFVAPFSFGRMTWVKPSFLWMMARSNWGARRGQERILAVRMCRFGFFSVLQQSVLTAFDPALHVSHAAWRDAFDVAAAHVQWDPERTLRGAKLDDGAIQVGIGRSLIRRYADEWVQGIDDVTAVVDKMRTLRARGRHDVAQRLLPRETEVVPSTTFEVNALARVTCD